MNTPAGFPIEFTFSPDSVRQTEDTIEFLDPEHVYCMSWDVRLDTNAAIWVFWNGKQVFMTLYGPGDKTNEMLFFHGLVALKDLSKIPALLYLEEGPSVLEIQVASATRGFEVATFKVSFADPDADENVVDFTV